MAGDVLADARTARNGRHDPAMRWIVAFKAAQGSAASPSQMARFGTMWLAAEKNLAARSDLSDRWIDRAQARRSTGSIALDIDSSVSPTHNEQEMSVTRNANCAATSGAMPLLPHPTSMSFWRQRAIGTRFALSPTPSLRTVSPAF